MRLKLERAQSMVEYVILLSVLTAMVAATLAAVSSGGGQFQNALKKLFGRLDISLKVPKSITKRQILDIISRDKKAVQKWPRFVLLEKTGKVLCKNGQFALQVERKIVEETIDILLNRNL